MATDVKANETAMARDYAARNARRIRESVVDGMEVLAAKLLRRAADLKTGVGVGTLFGAEFGPDASKVDMDLGRLQEADNCAALLASLAPPTGPVAGKRGADGVEGEGEGTGAFEATFIADPDLSEEDLARVIERHQENAKNAGAEVLALDNWGKRRTAYEINGKRTGTYVTMRFRTTAIGAGMVERAMKADEDLLRALVVRLS